MGRGARSGGAGGSTPCATTGGAVDDSLRPDQESRVVRVVMERPVGRGFMGRSRRGAAGWPRYRAAPAHKEVPRNDRGGELHGGPCITPSLAEQGAFRNDRGRHEQGWLVRGVGRMEDVTLHQR